jgi:hypothetical protein
VPFTTRVEPIDRDVALIIREDLSPAAQSRMLAETAGEMIAEGDETNRQRPRAYPAAQDVRRWKRGGCAR